MFLGITLTEFSWPGGEKEIGSRIRKIAPRAEEVGFDWIMVMDHFFQIIPPEEREMLEAYTTLGFIAGLTKRVRLSVMVTGVTYRHPGILAKTVTALDVLSGGRAMLGIGAAWNEREHLGLGVPFPPLKERFERLEETLQIVHQMWSENNGPYEGKHYQLAETLNLPPAVQQPHPPILIGGSGGPKNLRLVARYADACNIFGDAEALRERFALLKELCAEEGRDYDAIERTAGTPLDLGKKGENVGEAVEKIGGLAEAGVQSLVVGLRGVGELEALEIAGRDLIPQIKDL